MRLSKSFTLAEMCVTGTGKPITPFMKYGDVVRIEMRSRDGVDIFGAIEQRIERPEA